MKRSVSSFLILLLALTGIAASQQIAPAPITVDCSKGQSLSQALAKLDKHTPTTALVNGTCTEAVQVIGFENLTLKGLPGATLVQPSTSGSSALTILSSRSVLVINFSVQGTTASAIGIGHGSSDILLRELNITGGGPGITVFENSQVSIAYVKAQTSGYAILAIYDSSDVHFERCQLIAAPGGWTEGIQIGASHITMYDVTITDTQVGIAAGSGSI